MTSVNEQRTASGLPKVCECGCGESVTSSRPNARYATGACRTRAWKAKKGYTDSRRVQASRNAKRGPSRTRRKPSVRISYRKAVDAVAAALARIGGDTVHDDHIAQFYFDEAYARERAEEILDPLLTPAGREALR